MSVATGSINKLPSMTNIDLWNETMERVKSGLIASSLAISFVVSAALAAGEPPVQVAEGPYRKIEQITVDLLNVIEQHREGYPVNQFAFFAALNSILDTSVDFKYIAKQVMGPYAKTASTEQRELFAQVFRDGLVETYGRGLIGYSGQEMILLNHADIKPGQRKLVVKQEIRGVDGVYPLAYTMAFKKSTGQWMILNMTINGISLRKTFQSQFLQSAKKLGGDIDQVVAGWK
jgi:phospholipid transport system substrate-binding protein